MKILAQIVLLSAPWALSTLAMADGADFCPTGIYRLRDGATIDVAPSDGDTLRWLSFSGERGQLHPGADGQWSSTFGWTDRPDGKSVSFSVCSKHEMLFDGKPGSRLEFDIQNVTFESQGVQLKGRLVMPKGSGKVPVVVLIHGSEHESALDTYPLQRLFPAHDIGVFVYDKRGTGASGGSYTQDFALLSKDATAAMQTAKRLAGSRLGRIGYQGGSQGGWVVPLASNSARVDFAIVSFGLAVSIMDEDQESVALDMYFHHHSDADALKAAELARAAELVIESGGHHGYEEFDALRSKYRSEPWYKDVHGDFLFFILPLDQKQIIEAMTKDFNFVEARTPFRYDPMPALKASNTPQLWVLGSDDLEAPSAETAERIKSLIQSGKDYSLAVYPGAEHGMTIYELDAKGERVSTRFAPEYFKMMADFIRLGRIGDHYGNAAIMRPIRPAS